MSPPAPSAQLPAGRGPIGVLHLLDPSVGGEGAILACSAATQTPGLEHRVWVLGSPADLHAAEVAGVANPVGVTTSLGVPETALRSLWRLRTADPVEPQAVIAWSPASLHLATTIWGRRTTIVGIMPVGPSTAGSGWLGRRRLTRAIHRTTIVPLGPALQDAWGGAVGIGVTAITPPTPMLNFPSSRRAALREELGIQNDELAVLLLADPPSLADGRRFAQTIGMARLTGVPAVGLMHRATPDWGRALRFTGAHRREWDLIRIDGPLAQAVGAADVCVWDQGVETGRRASEQGPVLALAAAAAGVPIIARDTPLAREVLEPAADPCLIAHEQERLQAGAIVRLSDPAVRDATARTLAAHATRDGRLWRFHEELIDTLRLVAANAQSTADWWNAAEHGTVA